MFGIDTARLRLYGLGMCALALLLLNLFAPIEVSAPSAIVPAVPTRTERTTMVEKLRNDSASTSQGMRPMLEAARADPFFPIPAAPVQPLAPPPVAVPPVPVAPSPPPHLLTFTGRVEQPDGSVAVYADVAGNTIALTSGMVLSTGYRVDAVSDTLIELSYPPLGTQARVNIPASSKFQIR